jgi:RNA polymerase sigma-70 factor, ECF subfamily
MTGATTAFVISSTDSPQSIPVLAAHDTFEDVVVPHLGAAYRVARWLMRNDDDAEDVVQDASVRALRYFRTFSGGDGRAWFLTIVRNTCFGWRGRRLAPTDPFDEERHHPAQPRLDPEALLLQTDQAALVARALGHLPSSFHQLLILRELEALSYRELADAMEIPIGTVMSRLSRARQALRGAVSSELAVSRTSSTSCRRPQPAVRMANAPGEAAALV